MINENRLSGHIDQLDEVLYFEDDAMDVQTWDGMIEGFLLFFFFPKFFENSSKFNKIPSKFNKNQQNLFKIHQNLFNFPSNSEFQTHVAR